MPQADIATQLAAGNLLLRHDPRRVIARIGLRLLAAVAPIVALIGRPWWLLAAGSLSGIVLGCLAFVTAIQWFRGVPVLQASESGIWLTREDGGRAFVSWPDTVGFIEYVSAVGIRLSEGSRPVASAWARGFAGKTLVVSVGTTGASPSEIAHALGVLRSRYLAA
jgi:hypothetical protein